MMDGKWFKNLSKNQVQGPYLFKSNTDVSLKVNIYRNISNKYELTFILLQIILNILIFSDGAFCFCLERYSNSCIFLSYDSFIIIIFI